MTDSKNPKNGQSNKVIGAPLDEMLELLDSEQKIHYLKDRIQKLLIEKQKYENQVLKVPEDKKKDALITELKEDLENNKNLNDNLEIKLSKALDKVEAQLNIKKDKKKYTLYDRILRLGSSGFSILESLKHQIVDCLNTDVNNFDYIQDTLYDISSSLGEPDESIESDLKLDTIETKMVEVQQVAFSLHNTDTQVRKSLQTSIGVQQDLFSLIKLLRTRISKLKQQVNFLKEHRESMDDKDISQDNAIGDYSGGSFVSSAFQSSAPSTSSYRPNIPEKNKLYYRKHNSVETNQGEEIDPHALAISIRSEIEHEFNEKTFQIQQELGEAQTKALIAEKEKDTISSRLDKSQNEYNKLVEKYKKLNAQNKENQNKSDELEKKLTIAKKQIAKLTGKPINDIVDEEQEKIKKLKANLIELKERYDKSKEDLKNLNEEFNLSKQKVTQLEEDKKKITDDLQSKIDELQKKSSATTAENQKLRKYIEAYKKNYNESKNSIKSLETQLSKVSSDAAQQLKESNDKLEIQSSDSKKMEEKLKDQNKKLLDSLNKLRSALGLNQISNEDNDGIKDDNNEEAINKVNQIIEQSNDSTNQLKSIRKSLGIPEEDESGNSSNEKGEKNSLQQQIQQKIESMQKQNEKLKEQKKLMRIHLGLNEEEEEEKENIDQNKPKSTVANELSKMKEENEKMKETLKKIYGQIGGPENPDNEGGNLNASDLCESIKTKLNDLIDTQEKIEEMVGGSKDEKGSNLKQSLIEGIQQFKQIQDRIIDINSNEKFVNENDNQEDSQKCLEIINKLYESYKEQKSFTEQLESIINPNEENETETGTKERKLNAKERMNELIQEIAENKKDKEKLQEQLNTIRTQLHLPETTNKENSENDDITQNIISLIKNNEELKTREKEILQEFGIEESENENHKDNIIKTHQDKSKENEIMKRTITTIYDTTNKSLSKETKPSEPPTTIDQLCQETEQNTNEIIKRNEQLIEEQTKLLTQFGLPIDSLNDDHSSTHSSVEEIIQQHQQSLAKEERMKENHRSLEQLLGLKSEDKSTTDETPEQTQINIENKIKTIVDENEALQTQIQTIRHQLEEIQANELDQKPISTKPNAHSHLNISEIKENGEIIEKQIQTLGDEYLKSKNKSNQLQKEMEELKSTFNLNDEPGKDGTISKENSLMNKLANTLQESDKNKALLSTIKTKIGLNEQVDENNIIDKLNEYKHVQDRILEINSKEEFMNENETKDDPKYCIEIIDKFYDRYKGIESFTNKLNSIINPNGDKNSQNQQISPEERMDELIKEVETLRKDKEQLNTIREQLHLPESTNNENSENDDIAQNIISLIKNNEELKTREKEILQEFGIEESENENHKDNIIKTHQDKSKENEIMKRTITTIYDTTNKSLSKETKPSEPPTTIDQLCQETEQNMNEIIKRNEQLIEEQTKLLTQFGLPIDKLNDDHSSTHSSVEEIIQQHQQSLAKEERMKENHRSLEQLLGLKSEDKSTTDETPEQTQINIENKIKAIIEENNSLQQEVNELKSNNEKLKEQNEKLKEQKKTMRMHLGLNEEEEEEKDESDTNSTAANELHNIKQDSEKFKEMTGKRKPSLIEGIQQFKQIQNRIIDINSNEGFVSENDNQEDTRTCLEIINKLYESYKEQKSFTEQLESIINPNEENETETGTKERKLNAKERMNELIQEIADNKKDKEKLQEQLNTIRTQLHLPETTNKENSENDDITQNIISLIKNNEELKTREKEILQEFGIEESENENHKDNIIKTHQDKSKENEIMKRTITTIYDTTNKSLSKETKPSEPPTTIDQLCQETEQNMNEIIKRNEQLIEEQTKLLTQFGLPTDNLTNKSINDDHSSTHSSVEEIIQQHQQSLAKEERMKENHRSLEQLLGLKSEDKSTTDETPEQKQINIENKIKTIVDENEALQTQIQTIRHQLEEIQANEFNPEPNSITRRPRRRQQQQQRQKEHLNLSEINDNGEIIEKHIEAIAEEYSKVKNDHENLQKEMKKLKVKFNIDDEMDEDIESIDTIISKHKDTEEENKLMKKTLENIFRKTSKSQSPDQNKDELPLTTSDLCDNVVSSITRIIEDAGTLNECQQILKANSNENDGIKQTLSNLQKKSDEYDQLQNTINEQNDKISDLTSKLLEKDSKLDGILEERSAYQDLLIEMKDSIDNPKSGNQANLPLFQKLLTLSEEVSNYHKLSDKMNSLLDERSRSIAFLESEGFISPTSSTEERDKINVPNQIKFLIDQYKVFKQESDNNKKEKQAVLNLLNESNDKSNNYTGDLPESSNGSIIQAFKKIKENEKTLELQSTQLNKEIVQLKDSLEQIKNSVGLTNQDENLEEFDINKIIQDISHKAQIATKLNEIIELSEHEESNFEFIDETPQEEKPPEGKSKALLMIEKLEAFNKKYEQMCKENEEFKTEVAKIKEILGISNDEDIPLSDITEKIQSLQNKSNKKSSTNENENENDSDNEGENNIFNNKKKSLDQLNEIQSLLNSQLPIQMEENENASNEAADPNANMANKLKEIIYQEAQFEDQLNKIIDTIINSSSTDQKKDAKTMLKENKLDEISEKVKQINKSYHSLRKQIDQDQPYSDNYSDNEDEEKPSNLNPTDRNIHKHEKRSKKDNLFNNSAAINEIRNILSSLSQFSDLNENIEPEQAEINDSSLHDINEKIKEIYSNYMKLKEDNAQLLEDKTRSENEQSSLISQILGEDAISNENNEKGENVSEIIKEKVKALQVSQKEISQYQQAITNLQNEKSENEQQIDNLNQKINKLLDRLENSQSNIRLQESDFTSLDFFDVGQGNDNTNTTNANNEKIFNYSDLNNNNQNTQDNKVTNEVIEKEKETNNEEDSKEIENKAIESNPVKNENDEEVQTKLSKKKSVKDESGELLINVEFDIVVEEEEEDKADENNKDNQNAETENATQKVNKEENEVSSENETEIKFEDDDENVTEIKIENENNSKTAKENKQDETTKNENEKEIKLESSDNKIDNKNEENDNMKEKEIAISDPNKINNNNNENPNENIVPENTNQDKDKISNENENTKKTTFDFSTKANENDELPNNQLANKSFKDKITDLEQRCNELEGHVDKLKAKNRILTKEKNQLCKVLNIDIEDESDNQQDKSKKSPLVMNVKEMIQNAQAKNIENEKLNDLLNQQKSKMQEIEDNNKGIAEELKEAKSSIKALLIEKQSIADILGVELEDNENNQGSDSPLCASIQLLKEKLSDSNKEVEQLKSDLSEFQGIIQPSSGKKKSNNSDSKGALSVSEVLEKLKTQLNDLNQSNETKDETILDLREALSRQEEQNKQNKNKITKLNNKNTEMKKQLDEQKAQNEAKITELNDKNAQLEKQLDEQKAQNETKITELNDKKAQLKKQLDEQKAQNETKITELNDKNAQLEKQLEDQDSQNETKINKLNKENQKLKEKMEQLNQATQKDIQSLQKENEQIKSEVNTAVDALQKKEKNEDLSSLQLNSPLLTETLSAISTIKEQKEKIDLMAKKIEKLNQERKSILEAAYGESYVDQNGSGLLDELELLGNQMNEQNEKMNNSINEDNDTIPVSPSKGPISPRSRSSPRSTNSIADVMNQMREQLKAATEESLTKDAKIEELNNNVEELNNKIKALEDDNQDNEINYQNETKDSLIEKLKVLKAKLQRVQKENKKLKGETIENEEEGDLNSSKISLSFSSNEVILDKDISASNNDKESIKKVDPKKLLQEHLIISNLLSEDKEISEDELSQFPLASRVKEIQNKATTFNSVLNNLSSLFGHVDEDESDDFSHLSARIQEIHAINAALQSEIARLKEQLKQQNEKVEQLDAAFIEEEEEENEQNEQNKQNEQIELSKIIDLLHIEGNTRMDDIKDTITQLQKYENELKEIQEILDQDQNGENKNNDEIADRVKHLVQTNQELKVKIESLLGKLSDFSKDKEERQRYSRQIKHIENEMSAKDDNINQIQQMLNIKQSKNDARRKNDLIASLEKENSKLKQKNDELQKELEKLNKERNLIFNSFDDNNDEIKGEGNQIQNKINEMKEKLNKMQEKCQKLENEIENCRKQIQQKESENDSLLSKINKLNAQNKSLTQQIAKLKEYSDDYEEENENNNSKPTKAKSKPRSVDQLESQLKNLNEEMKKKENELTQIKLSLSPLINSESSENDLASNVKLITDENQKLKKDVKSFEKERKDIGKLFEITNIPPTNIKKNSSDGEGQQKSFPIMVKDKVNELIKTAKKYEARKFDNVIQLNEELKNEIEEKNQIIKELKNNLSKQPSKKSISTKSSQTNLEKEDILKKIEKAKKDLQEIGINTKGGSDKNNTKEIQGRIEITLNEIESYINNNELVQLKNSANNTEYENLVSSIAQAICPEEDKVSKNTQTKISAIISNISLKIQQQKEQISIIQPNSKNEKSSDDEEENARQQKMRAVDTLEGILHQMESVKATDPSDNEQLLEAINKLKFVGEQIEKNENDLKFVFNIQNPKVFSEKQYKDLLKKIEEQINNMLKALAKTANIPQPEDVLIKKDSNFSDHKDFDIELDGNAYIMNVNKSFVKICANIKQQFQISSTKQNHFTKNEAKFTRQIQELEAKNEKAKEKRKMDSQEIENLTQANKKLSRNLSKLQNNTNEAIKFLFALQPSITNIVKKDSPLTEIIRNFTLEFGKHVCKHAGTTFMNKLNTIKKRQDTIINAFNKLAINVKKLEDRHSKLIHSQSQNRSVQKKSKK